MKRKGICNCLSGPSLLFTGGLSRREDLLRTIQGESRCGGVYELLAQSFRAQGCDGLIAAVFQKMAAEKRRCAAVLEWFYRRRFGPVPSATAALSVDCKTLNRVLCAGVHRLIQEKAAANRRVSGPVWKKAARMGWSFLHGIWGSPEPAPSQERGFF